MKNQEKLKQPDETPCTFISFLITHSPPLFKISNRLSNPFEWLAVSYNPADSIYFQFLKGLDF